MPTDPLDIATGDKLTRRIRARSRGLSKALVRVLEYIDTNRLEVMTKPAVELAAAIGTSDATVIRAIQALGFEGLKDLKRELAASFGQGLSAADNMARTFSRIGDEQNEAIDRVMQDHQAAFSALVSDETRQQINAAVRLLSKSRHIGIFGIGPSSFLAGYFAVQMSRIGRPTRVFDGGGSTYADRLLHMHEVDAVVMLAYGRPYREASACIGEARRLRKPIVLITDEPEKGMAAHAKIVLVVHRGTEGRVALHGATFVCLEAIMLATAALDKPRSIETLERLNALRKAIRKTPQ